MGVALCRQVLGVRERVVSARVDVLGAGLPHLLRLEALHGLSLLGVALQARVQDWLRSILTLAVRNLGPQASKGSPAGKGENNATKLKCVA